MNFMKKLITIFTVLSLISCKKEVSKTEIKKEKVPETKVWVSKNQKFLDQFKTVDFDTLKVYSGEEIYNENFEFFGKKIDSSDLKLFPQEIKLKTVKIAISFFIKFISSNLQKSSERFYNFTIQRLYIIFALCK